MKFPEEIQLTGNPERFYIMQRDGKVFELWAIFARSDVDDVKQNIQRMLSELSLPSDEVLQGISQTPLGRSSFNIVYEKKH